MNNVQLIGRLTKDIQLTYTQDQKAVARFTIAVQKDKDNTDFISCVAFGKTAENMGLYTKKGSLIAVEGRLTSGSYEKDGRTVYTLDVFASRVEFLQPKSQQTQPEPSAPTGYQAIDEEIPF